MFQILLINAPEGFALFRFTNINKIAELKTEDLTTLPGIGEKTAEKIIEAAKEAIK